ncbi:tetratricopeptide repeat protein [Streptomyces sp. NPDC059009]|uniref:tetratricopeptide repeat protein n=1 Tax=Streptomyces sp. NPDC059009 TaxID=3346694 RepID=UPI003695FA51
MSESEITTLVAAVSSALVQAMATEAWPTVRDRVAGLYGRRAAAEAVRLDAARAELLAGDRDGGHEDDAQAEWRAQLLGLLADNPGAAEELRDVAEEFEPLADDSPQVCNSVPGGRAETIVQAGTVTSLTVHERPAPQVSRDHVDFSKGTFHGSVIGAQHIYDSRGSGARTPDWRPAQELGPAEIGVRPTRRVPGLPDIPPYAARDIDPELAAALDGGGLVLLLGKPCSGTSYTAWNALRALDGHQVYAPERGADLRALLGPVKENPGQYVLWLDDIEGHLGERGLEPSLLERFKVLGVRILATMDPDTYYERRTGSRPGDRAIAHARTVELPGRWTEAELARLAEHTEDPRSYEAYLWSENAGPPAHLALGHLLHEEWQRLSARDADPAGVAVVRAALDVARCGYAAAVPLKLLVALGAPGETTEWAATERCGYAGFLLPGEEPGTWRAHGALVAGELRVGRPVTDDLQWEVYDATKPDSPEERAVIDGLVPVLRSRAAAGDVDDAYALSMEFTSGDESDEWLRAAADGGHAGAVARLADRLLDQGRTDEALPYLERAAANGAVWAIGELTRRHLALALAEGRLTKAVVGRPVQAVAVGDLMAGTPGREAEAMRHYLRAWQGGSADAALRIAGLLRDQGRSDEAEAWYRHAAEARDTIAAHSLGVLLSTTPGHDPAEVEQLFTRAADAGHAQAATALGVLKEGRGDMKAAHALYKKGDAGGDPEAAYRISRLAKDPKIRKAWLKRAAIRGHYQAGKETGAFEPPPAPDTVKK